MAKMEDEIHRIQSEHDRLDKRLDAIEMHTGAAAADEPDPDTTPRRDVASAAAASAPTPKLRVVTIDAAGNASSPEPSPDPNDPGERPTLQVFGTSPPHTAHAGRPAGSDTRGRDSGASAFDPAAKPAYDRALALVNAKKYDEALDAFAAFLVKWPDHPNADNATYWRGECYFAKGDYSRAAEQLEGTVARFPYGNKAPDALLKLGVTYDKLGDATRAKQARDRLTNDYPRSEAARKLAGASATKSPEKQGAP